MKNNQDVKTVQGFGDEWERFDQSNLSSDELGALFDKYFKIFPWNLIDTQSIGFDMGCGSGRWARLVADRVGELHCIDPSSALSVAQKNLSDKCNCHFHAGGVGDFILPAESMDFGYSLGVLHHVPDTRLGIEECVKFLKYGAPFLIYLYYAFDNRPFWFRAIWKLSDFLRLFISRLPHELRFMVSQIIAALVYFPLARFALLCEKMGVHKDVCDVIPLGAYRNTSFYTMRTDALDRFGTRLEHRFTKKEIIQMMTDAGLTDIKFSDDVPFWCAVGIKRVK